MASNQKCLWEKVPEGGLIFLDATFKKKKERERNKWEKKKLTVF